MSTVQTVQYIQPQHHERLGQAELLVIDEAAAIPLPLVKAMLGPYLVFLCSTVNGCADALFRCCNASINKNLTLVIPQGALSPLSTYVSQWVPREFTCS